jgi:phosphatidylinositol glycan class V
MAAMLIANISHLLSVLVLYRLAQTLRPASKNASIPFAAAALHIISPAGLFLSAPYAESLFSLLQFSAILMYCWSTPGLITTGQVPKTTTQRVLSHDLYLLLSGLLFAVAATVRGNALFAGSIYAYDGMALLPHLLPLPRSLTTVRHALSVILAGLLILAGFAFPQSLAYLEYCTGDVASTAQWCSDIPPSIYAYAQNHYWVNGFLRYWTLSNLPLFILAAPMLAILCASSFSALNDSSPIQSLLPIPTSNVLKRLAILQLVLASIVFTTANVQIITRIASGYPLLYIWIAQRIHSEQQEVSTVAKSKSKRAPRYAQMVTRWMVMYALIQGGLYASFLPPA